MRHETSQNGVSQTKHRSIANFSYPDKEIIKQQEHVIDKDSYISLKTVPWVVHVCQTQ